MTSHKTFASAQGIQLGTSAAAIQSNTIAASLPGINVAGFADIIMHAGQDPARSARKSGQEKF